MELNNLVFPAPPMRWKPSDFIGKLMFIPREESKKRAPIPVKISRAAKPSKSINQKGIAQLKSLKPRLDRANGVQPGTQLMSNTEIDEGWEVDNCPTQENIEVDIDEGPYVYMQGNIDEKIENHPQTIPRNPLMFTKLPKSFPSAKKKENQDAEVDIFETVPSEGVILTDSAKRSPFPASSPKMESRYIMAKRIEGSIRTISGGHIPRVAAPFLAGTKEEFDRAAENKTFHFIPSMLHQYTEGSDSLILYFHANGEDIGSCAGLCAHLNRTLNVVPSNLDQCFGSRISWIQSE